MPNTWTKNNEVFGSNCWHVAMIYHVFFFYNSDSLVRLNDGKSDAHGRVEVYNDRTGWGTICNVGWSNADAVVFCRQLGFADGQTHP